MYLHDKGEQFYLHYDLWPTVPFIHHSKPDEKFLDIVIEKQLQLHYENCNEETFRYFGKYDKRGTRTKYEYIIYESQIFRIAKIY